MSSVRLLFGTASQVVGVHTLKFIKSCLVPAARSAGALEPLFLVAAFLEGS